MARQDDVYKIGEVIQLSPVGPWPLTLAVVTEVCSWGVVADIFVPRRDSPPDIAPVRLAWEHFDRLIVERDEHGVLRSLAPTARLPLFARKALPP